MEKDICRRCHRKLTDAKSIELGFGKTCYKKYLKRKKNYLFEMEVSNAVIIERDVQSGGKLFKRI